MEQLNRFRDSHPLRYGALLIGMGIVAGFGFGAWSPIGTQRVVTQQVTPQVCKDALEMDDDIFVTLGGYLGMMDFAGATDYVSSVTDERVALYDGCMSK